MCGETDAFLVTSAALMAVRLTCDVRGLWPVARRDGVAGPAVPPLSACRSPAINGVQARGISELCTEPALPYGLRQRFAKSWRECGG